jgi:cellulose synthase/poly-beta-1,6-N-acetylglucosamine synthase-like glycosyltransferase
MKKQKPTLTIGIPAYNEEENIGFIIADMLKNSAHNYLLTRIVVVSDGSSDKTVDIACSFKDEHVVTIDNTKRQGIAAIQNQIIRVSDTDILVIINADTHIEDRQFFEKLIRPILYEDVDLTSTKMQALPPRSFFERCLYAGTEFRNDVFEALNKGDNVFTCHGTARAFSKKLYKQLIFIDNANEDAYSYLFSKVHHFKYKYVAGTCIFYKLPDNLRDYERQNQRFYQSINPEFNEDYELPRFLIVKKLLTNFLNNPAYLFLYLIIFTYAKIISKKINNQETWQVKSSKKLFFHD